MGFDCVQTNFIFISKQLSENRCRPEVGALLEHQQMVLKQRAWELGGCQAEQAHGERSQPNRLCSQSGPSRCWSLQKGCGSHLCGTPERGKTKLKGTSLQLNVSESGNLKWAFVPLVRGIPAVAVWEELKGCPHER